MRSQQALSTVVSGDWLVDLVKLVLLSDSDRFRACITLVNWFGRPGQYV